MARAKKRTYGLLARLEGGNRSQPLTGKTRDRYAALQSGGQPQSMRVPESPAHKRKSRKSNVPPFTKSN